MIAAIIEQAQQRGPLLYAKEIHGQTKSQRYEQIDDKAQGGHAESEQPETTAQALSLCGCYATRRPERGKQKLQAQEDQRREHKQPIGKDCGRNKRTKATECKQDNPLDHPPSITGFVEHNNKLYLFYRKDEFIT